MVITFGVDSPGVVHRPLCTNEQCSRHVASEEWSTNYTVFFDIITPEFNASRNVADKEISIAASRGLPKLTQTVIRSSHGHSAPSLKISCKSVQPFSCNVAEKEISIAASRGSPELTQNVITSSHRAVYPNWPKL